MKKVSDKKHETAIDLSEKLKPYEDQWVALSLDHKEVLGSGKTLKKAQQEAESKGKDYTFIKLPPFDISYVPAF
jgi:hypothetical protein